MRYLAAVLALVTLPATAATVSWSHPTAYADGSPLPLADIASTTIEWGPTEAFPSVAGSQVVTGTATSATVPDPPAGTTRCYRARTTVVAAKGGGVSEPSNSACKTGAFPRPRPPTLLDVVVAWLRNVFGRFA